MLNKAKVYCEKNNITTKAISLKLLRQSLDYVTLEEDGILQDKWSILLSNMVDSEQIQEWIDDYNNFAPHSALKMKISNDFFNFK